LPLPQPGDRIDSFELEHAIGVGGMGAVFRALDGKLDRHVALKVLPPEQAHDAEVVQRFYQEGRAAARLDHENIARVYTIGHDKGYHFIAFEFIEGVTIRQRVERDGPLPVAEAVNYTLQIASALVHASERGVVHRDIKPSNIIVTPHGRAKLVDMGLARRFERGGDDGLTQSGMTLGTFDYISPEQARDPRDVDVRSDLYSLGCTLFHMLSGRPPFPEGTVLQKLIQHQEEPPPDVRELNPDVPADLAAILMKLMAKERDRRYQAPEQLVRDLLILAGALGLRSVSPEGLLWMSAARAPAWERHLVWALPSFAFVIVVAALAWWGQDTGAPAPAAPVSPPNLVAQPVPPKPPAGSSRADSPPASKPAEAGVSEPLEPASDLPREIAVDSGEDLLAVLASAPPRSVVVLSDDGPYVLGASSDPQAAGRLSGCDVTVKADSGVRPVLRLSRETGSGSEPRAAVLDFLGGRVALEGLEFVLDPGDRDEAASVRAENTELTLRRCSFRRQGAHAGRGRVAALRLRATPAALGGDRAPAVAAEACHFDPGQVAVLATGPVDLQVRDCTIAAAEPAFWFDNGKSTRAVAVDLRLRHNSILASDGPVFRFEGTDPRVRVDDTVVASARGVRGTLVATDDPDALDWRGRGNLYGRLRTFLQPTGARSGRGPVRDAAQWADSLADVRETGSTATEARVWDETDPAESLAQESQNPTRAFRLSRSSSTPPGVGVRQGPFGAPATTVTVASNTAGAPRLERAVPGGPRRSAEPPRGEASESPLAPMPMNVPTSTDSTGTASPAPADSNDSNPMAPMRPPDTETPEKGVPETPRPEKPTVAEPGTPRTPAVEADPTLLRTADQFLNALGQLGERGGVLRVAADADWELPSTELLGAGRWTVRAEPGATRPRLRFRPGPDPLRTPSAWSCWIELRSGSLQLEGLDIVLPRADAPRQGRWAAFGVGAGADLSLVDCTVTVEGERATSAVVAVRAGEPGDDPARGTATAATVRFSRSLLRGGGDLVEVAPGRRLDLDLNDAVVSTRGSLVHAHGAPRAASPEPVRLKVVVRQVTARTAGGLVQLESAPGEPDLPVADVNARDSILATTPQGDPLFRVDGQDSLASLRDRIAWEGHGVAYHQISTYRRDQSAQVGAVPSIYDQPSWAVAVGPREASALHGDVKFLREWDASRPAWTLRVDDVRLSPDSPATGAGADPASIPEPPAAP
jgi:serine/threonine-protein kinase